MTFLVFEIFWSWASYKQKTKFLELRGCVSTPKKIWATRYFFRIQHSQGDSIELILSILRFKHRFFENITLPYALKYIVSQVFCQNLKPRLDKFSLYCFQVGIDHSFFYHSSSAIAIFHTTFQELFNRVIYFRLLKQKYAAICAQTWTIEKKPSIFFSFNRISQLFTNRFG